MTSRNTLDDKLYNQWKDKAKSKLKQKILDNIQNRINVLESATVDTIKSEKTWKYIEKSLNIFNIKQYQKLTKTFKVQDSFVDTVKNKLYPIIEEWRGVNVEAMHVPPSTFEEYHKKATNYWNAHTAKWLGDFLFYPFLDMELDAYIDSIHKSHVQNIKSFHKNTTCTNNVAISETEAVIEVPSYETCQLLKYFILRALIHTTIKFHKTRDQPLILDQSFAKSKLLKQYFIDIGDKTDIQIPWKIPPNTKVT